MKKPTWDTYSLDINITTIGNQTLIFKGNKAASETAITNISLVSLDVGGLGSTGSTGSTGMTGSTGPTGISPPPVDLSMNIFAKSSVYGKFVVQDKYSDYDSSGNAIT